MPSEMNKKIDIAIIGAGKSQQFLERVAQVFSAGLTTQRVIIVDSNPKPAPELEIEIKAYKILEEKQTEFPQHDFKSVKKRNAFFNKRKKHS
jgi:hypothetical protein